MPARVEPGNLFETVEDFHNPEDFARSGRIGNTITLNGRAPSSLPVRAGERIRLRLILEAIGLPEHGRPDATRIVFAQGALPVDDLALEV